MQLLGPPAVWIIASTFESFSSVFAHEEAVMFTIN